MMKPMSDKVKDIAIKAAYGPVIDLADPLFLQKYSAKFAELLLKEVTAVLNKKDPDFNDYSKRVLSEHFGVKL